MIVVTWKYPDGTEGHESLPRNWGQTSGICEANAERYGFVRVETEIPDPPPPPTYYSKYRLVAALKERGKWDEVKAALSDYWDEWLVAQDLSSEDANFQYARAAFVRMYGEELVAAVLAQAEAGGEELGN